MKNKEYISIAQLKNITIGFLLGTSLIISIGIKEAKRDAWISQIIAAFMGIAVIIMISYIIKKFPKCSLEEILNTLVGKNISKLIIAYLGVYSFILSLFILNNIAVFMNIVIMQDTPIWVFIFTISLTTAYIVKKGIEVTARCVEIIIPFTLVILTILLILLGIISFDINNLKPFFASNFRNILKPSIAIFIFPYGEAIILLFLNTLVRDKENLTKNNVKAVIISSIYLILRPVAAIGVYGVKQASTLVFPAFLSVRTIKVGDFFTRIELFMVVAWFLTAFVKLAVSIYVTSKSIEYSFSLKDYKDILIPLSIIMVPLAAKSYTNYVELKEFVHLGWVMFNIPLQFIFIIVFIISIFSKDKKFST
jgi:spore germination protein KB